MEKIYGRWGCEVAMNAFFNFTETKLADNPHWKVDVKNFDPVNLKRIDTPISMDIDLKSESKQLKFLVDEMKETSIRNVDIEPIKKESGWSNDITGKLIETKTTKMHDEVYENHVPDKPEDYRRPYLRKEVVEEIYARAPQDKQGRYLDPNTGKPIDGTPDIGHKAGHEHRREVKIAYDEHLTQKEFNEKMNNPDYYQLEDPSNNRSHKFEDKSEYEGE